MGKHSALSDAPSDELWALYQDVQFELAARLENQIRELEDRLRLVKPEAVARSPPRKLFRNPAEPHEEWTGRGRRPHWLTRLLKTGVSIEELEVVPRRHCIDAPNHLEPFP